MNASLHGEALRRQGRYPEALDQFEAALAHDAHDAQARQGEIDTAIRWASQQVSKQHADEAMTILERGMRQVPDSPELLVSFGVEATALQQFAIASQALAAADRLQPGRPETTYALARLALEQQHMPEAEGLLKRYLADRPRDATAYFGLGHLYAMEQREPEARAAFLRSLELQPRQTESCYQLGQIELEAHHDQAAGTWFSKVLTRDPHHVATLTGMGQLALRSHQYAEAEQYLAAAERWDPGYAPAHYFRGLALAHLGQNEAARQELQRGDSREHATPLAQSGPQATSAEPAPSAPQR